MENRRGTRARNPSGRFRARGGDVTACPSVRDRLTWHSLPRPGGAGSRERRTDANATTRSAIKTEGCASLEGRLQRRAAHMHAARLYRVRLNSRGGFLSAVPFLFPFPPAAVYSRSGRDSTAGQARPTADRFSYALSYSSPLSTCYSIFKDNQG